MLSDSKVEDMGFSGSIRDFPCPQSLTLTALAPTESEDPADLEDTMRLVRFVGGDSCQGLTAPISEMTALAPAELD